MTDQITLEKALELVDFELGSEGWRVKSVKGSVYGDIFGSAVGNIWGDVGGSVCNVWGNVGGTIKGRQWEFIETPKEKLKRLIEEGAGKDEILEALDQLAEKTVA